MSQKKVYSIINQKGGVGKTQFGCYNILTSTKTIDECAIQTEIPNLNLVTANESLLGIEIELSSFEDRALRLKKEIEGINNYDFILLDCPPALNIITLKINYGSTFNYPNSWNAHRNINSNISIYLVVL